MSKTSSLKRWWPIAICVIAICLLVYMLVPGKASAPDDRKPNAATTAQLDGSGPGEVPASELDASHDTSGNKQLRPHAWGLMPYAYVPYNDDAFSGYVAHTNVDHVFASFVLGNSCTPVWAGDANLDMSSSRSDAIANAFAKTRAKGGDAAVSFGGEAGSELAASCTDPAQLQQAYQNVIDTYKLVHINFDLEHEGVTDAAAMARRVQAVAALQKANKNLRVSLTLQVGTTGLDTNAQNAVKAFRDGGVVLSNVNIMAMAFVKSPLSEVDRITAAATATATQLEQLYPGITKAEAYRALGVVVMPGDNGNNEFLTLADAKAVQSFASKNNVGTLSYWSTNRDQQCSSDTQNHGTCSGVAQSQYQFAKLLNL